MPNQLATTDRKDIRSTLEGMKDQFKMALPKLLTPERFTRVALTCINKNPKLLSCTRESLLACLMDCAMLGIEPDGRRAHLIPYGDKCTLILDYKGIVELVRRSGDVSDIHADIICENDQFDYMFGTGSFLTHKIDVRKPRGEVVGAYSFVKLKDGSESFDVMGVEEIETVRKRSRAGNNGPWVTDKAEMQKKTVFRRHSKWLPISPELRENIEKDDEPLTETERFHAAKQVPSTDIQFGPALPTDAEQISGADTELREESGGNEGPSQSASELPLEAQETMPERATPLEGLRNLLKASNFDESAFLDAARDKEVITTKATQLEKLPVQTLKLLIGKFTEIAGV